MNKHNLEALLDFELVGARFSRLCVDEANILEDNSKFTVTVECDDPAISAHTYDGRPVIELVIGMSANAKDNQEGRQGEVFALECTAGFVGRVSEFDGDLQRFATCAPHFSRSVYWMLRERLDSIFAVTMLRTARPIHWDTLREVHSTTGENIPSSTHRIADRPATKTKTKSAKKRVVKKSQ